MRASLTPPAAHSASPTSKLQHMRKTAGSLTGISLPMQASFYRDPVAHLYHPGGSPMGIRVDPDRNQLDRSSRIPGNILRYRPAGFLRSITTRSRPSPGTTARETSPVNPGCLNIISQSAETDNPFIHQQNRDGEFRTVQLRLEPRNRTCPR